MKALVGLRDYNVYTNVTSATLVPSAAYMEVTNSGGTDVTVYLNDYPDQGHPAKNIAGKGIPIKAGTTREIPVLTGNITATGPVTIVAYTV